MIQFGGLQGTTHVCPTVGSADVCTGVSFQDVFLEMNKLNAVGIENDYAQDLSYVDHVNFHNIGGTGLVVTANGSGPYSNLSCAVNEPSGNTFPMQCVKFTASNTLGLHGMTTPIAANPAPPQPAVAVSLDGSNNSLEDIHIEGFVDGIRIGENADAESNTLLDINAGDGAGSVTNAIHICGSNAPSGATVTCSTSHTVTDLSIVGALIVHAVMGHSVTATLQDDVTSVWLKQQIGTNTSSVGLYLLGASASAGTVTAYSRFTTSPYTPSSQITPTWAVGSSAPTTGAACSNPGSLYTNTGTGSTLYVCVAGTGTGTGWQPVV